MTDAIYAKKRSAMHAVAHGSATTTSWTIPYSGQFKQFTIHTDGFASGTTFVLKGSAGGAATPRSLAGMSDVNQHFGVPPSATVTGNGLALLNLPCYLGGGITIEVTTAAADSGTIYVKMDDNAFVGPTSTRS